MRRLATAVMCSLVALPAAFAAQFNGYLSVNDEDYGYWEGVPTVLLFDEEVPIDELTGRHAEIAFEIEHDLARGLVRQYTRQRQGEGDSTQAGRIEASAEDSLVGTAGGRVEVEPPSGGGGWAYLYRFQSFGFGLYRDSDATHHLYCENGPTVWAWLSSGTTERTSPDDAADMLVRNADGMARLKLTCERPLEVTN